MATYTVIPAIDRTGFHVAIQGSDGIRQTILGFETSVEAEAWIEHDRRLSAVQAPWDSTGSRIPIELRLCLPSAPPEPRAVPKTSGFAHRHADTRPDRFA
jgi:hypothetical protein